MIKTKFGRDRAWAMFVMPQTTCVMVMIAITNRFIFLPFDKLKKILLNTLQ